MKTTAVEVCITDNVSFFAGAAGKLRDRLGTTPAKDHALSILTLHPDFLLFFFHLYFPICHNFLTHINKQVSIELLFNSIRHQKTPVKFKRACARAHTHTHTQLIKRFSEMAKYLDSSMNDNEGVAEMLIVSLGPTIINVTDAKGR